MAPLGDLEAFCWLALGGLAQPMPQHAAQLAVRRLGARWCLEPEFV